jgi:hypothetical protein
MKQKQYTWYSDPSHGWLKVPFKDLYDSGVSQKISSFSYLGTGSRFGYAFLEEDCDASLFLDAIDLEPTFKERHSNIRESFTRKLPRYSAERFNQGLAVQQNKGQWYI